MSGPQGPFEQARRAPQPIDPQVRDHGTHLAVYVTDPDGKRRRAGLRPPAGQWPPYDSAEFIDASMDIDGLITLA